jgi:hypothetical protein
MKVPALVCIAPAGTQSNDLALVLSLVFKY